MSQLLPPALKVAGGARALSPVGGGAGSGRQPQGGDAGDDAEPRPLAWADGGAAHYGSAGLPPASGAAEKSPREKWPRHPTGERWPGRVLVVV